MQYIFLCLLVVMGITQRVPQDRQGLRTISVKGFVGRPQVQKEWCWAACIQSLFLTKGLVVEQSEIVRSAYGQALNKPAPGFEGTLAMLNKVIVDVKGEGWKIEAYARATPPDPGWLYSELKNNEAIMVWFRIPGADHSIVLVGGTCLLDANGDFVAWKSLTGYDPLFNRNLPIPIANLQRYVYGTFFVRIQRLDG